MDRVAIKKEARELTKTNKWNMWKPVLLISIISGVLGGIIAALKLDVTVKSLLETVVSIALLPTTVGLVAYTLKIVRGESFSLGILKDYYPQILTIIAVSILVSIFTTLWSLLLIIPGIIAAFSYSMVYYVLADNKDLSPLEAIKKSKELMKGHKWELFVFMLSFLGWEILATLTFGLLYIWLFPYMAIATAKFYDELKKAND